MKFFCLFFIKSVLCQCRECWTEDSNGICSPDTSKFQLQCRYQIKLVLRFFLINITRSSRTYRPRNEKIILGLYNLQTNVAYVSLIQYWDIDVQCIDPYVARFFGLRKFKIREPSSIPKNMTRKVSIVFLLLRHYKCQERVGPKNWIDAS